MQLMDFLFWKDFLANTLATVIGLLIGIPVALWINRNQQRSQEEIEKKRLMKESLSREAKVLQLVYHELKHNLDILAIYKGKESENIEPSLEVGYQLKDELWRAFSNSAEINWIRDLDLIDAVAHAYYGIRMVTTTSNSYLSYNHKVSLQNNYPDHLLPPVKEILKILHDHLKMSIGYASSYISDTLVMINEHLESS